MQTPSRSFTVAAWLLVGLVVVAAYLQWEQLSTLEEIAATTESLQSELSDLVARSDEPLPVDIAEVSLNAGLYDDVEGGFIQFSPIRIIDEGGEFDQFLRMPVSVVEPVDVRVEDEVDVYVTGGFVELGN